MARIIEGDVYKAHLEAKRIIEEAIQEAADKVQSARMQAKTLEEEEVSIGCNDANNETAQDVIRIFREREQRLLGAQAELRDLSLELAQRILGDVPRVPQEDYEALILSAVNQISSKRRLLIKGPPGSAARVAACRGIDFEEDCDISEGRAKVIFDSVEIECESAQAIASLTKNSYEN